MLKRWGFLVIVLAFTIMACQARHPQVRQVPESPAKKEQQLKPQKEEEVKVVSAKEAKVEEKEVVSKEELAIKSENECGSKSFPDIHFAFDRYDLNDEAKAVLAEIADYMKECPGIWLLIEGHCDERGSNEYNLALGKKRAEEAKKYLIMLGVAPDRIRTISYGEERPLCYEHNEECWALNRRDHFVFCSGTCFR